MLLIFVVEWLSMLQHPTLQAGALGATLEEESLEQLTPEEMHNIAQAQLAVVSAWL